MTRMPALSLAAVPGRRKATIELAREIERRGFTGIFGPSLGDSLALCEALDTSAAREVRRFIRDFIALNGEGQSDENIKLKSE